MGLYDAMGWIRAVKRVSHSGPWYIMGLWNKGLFKFSRGIEVEQTASWMGVELIHWGYPYKGERK